MVFAEDNPVGFFFAFSNIFSDSFALFFVKLIAPANLCLLREGLRQRPQGC